MTFDDAEFKRIAEEFRKGRPNDEHRIARFSMRDLIVELYPDIEGHRAQGYTLKGICEYLARVGAKLSEGTLKNYIQHARSKNRGKTAGSPEPRRRAAARKSRRIPEPHRPQTSRRSPQDTTRGTSAVNTATPVTTATPEGIDLTGVASHTPKAEVTTSCGTPAEETVNTTGAIATPEGMDVTGAASPPPEAEVASAGSETTATRGHEPSELAVRSRTARETAAISVSRAGAESEGTVWAPVGKSSDSPCTAGPIAAGRAQTPSFEARPRPKRRESQFFIGEELPLDQT